MLIIAGIAGCAVNGSGAGPAAASAMRTDRRADQTRPAGEARDLLAGGVRVGEGEIAAGTEATPAPAPDSKANYAFEIDAPEPLARLILANTLLGRWQYRDDYDFSQRALFARRAPEEVRQVLSTEGYFEPEVEIEESLFKVSMKVWTGVRSTVNLARIRFDGEVLGAAFAARRRQMEQAWPLPEGSFFDQRAWNNAKRDLLNALRNEGFPRAAIRDSRAAVDLEKTAVALEITVDSGPLTRIGRVVYNGLDRYDPSLLVPLQRFGAGDAYSLRALLDFQTRVRDTRWFTTVNVLPDLAALESDPSRRDIDIRVELVEARSERLTLGVGYSTDHGIRGQIGWIDRNWLGRAWQLETRLAVDKLTQQASIGVRTPLESEGHYWSAGQTVERQDIQNTVNETGSLFVGRGRQLGDIEYFASLTYQVDREIIRAADRAKTYTSERALVPGYSWNIRRLDSRLQPTTGYTFNAQVSGALDEVMSTANFLRGYSRTLRFIPMPRDSALKGGVLLLIAEGGAVFADSRNGIPSQNLFRAGGSQSIRGYSYQSIGIRRGTSIIGGRYLVAGTVEYQHPTPLPGVAGAVFYDRGGVDDDWRALRTVAGYGIGARLRTPVGPINVDLAYGQADRQLRFHLSIGYTF